MRAAFMPVVAWFGDLHKTVLRIMQDDRLYAIALALITPLLEKNAVKRRAVDSPLVFSMSRVIVLAFACGMLRQIWRVGIVGWPDATLSIAIVLALPVFGALDRVAPERVVDLAATLFNRFGVGAVALSAESGVREPSKYDDHRNDR